MKKETMIKLGFAAVGIIGVVAYAKAYTANENVKELLASMDKVSDGIDVDISESMLRVAVNNAADKAAKAATEKAVKEIREDISNTVARSVSKAVGDIKPAVQQSLEQKITMIDIAEIKKDVVKSTAKKLAEDMAFPNLFSGRNVPNSTAEIIKVCTDAGMSSWQIENILETAQK